MTHSKITGFRAPRPYLDNSFVRDSEAWNEIGQSPHGDNIQYDIREHRGKESEFIYDVNNRIEDETVMEKARIWWLIHRAIGKVTRPSTTTVLVRQPYTYKPK